MKTIVKSFQERTALWITLSALLIGGVAGVAVAGKGHHSGEHWVNHVSKKMSRKLSLTDAQQEKLEGVLMVAYQKRQTLRENMQQQVHDIVTQDSMSRDDALKLLTIRRDMRSEMQNNMADSLTEVHALLTPEQRMEAAEMAPKMLRKLQSRHNRHGKHHRFAFWKKWHDRDEHHDDDHHDDDH